MKFVLGLGFLALANAGTISWDAITGEKYTDVDCDTEGVIHAAMCGLPAPVTGCTNPSYVEYDAAATIDAGCDTLNVFGCTDVVADNYNPFAHTDDGSCDYFCSISGTGYSHDMFLFTEDVSCDDNYFGLTKSVTCNNGTATAGPTCRQVSDLKNNKAAARSHLKSSLTGLASRGRQNFYGGTADTKSQDYIDARNTARVDAKTARRNQLKTIKVDGMDWKDMVIEDEDAEVYTDKVLAKRAKRPLRPERKINYRLAPADLACQLLTPDLELEVGDIESIDLEENACVSVKVKNEAATVKIEYGSANEFKLTCSDPTSLAVNGLKAGDEYTCGGRVWDIGSLTTETGNGCVENAVPAGDGCECNSDTGYAGVDTDGDSEDDKCVVTGCLDGTACNFNASATFDDGLCTYPEANKDCTGDCWNDADDDGVCDENEVSGCTDPNACNFDVTATENDESCTYPEANEDCYGNCWVDLDECGVCGGSGPATNYDCDGNCLTGTDLGCGCGNPAAVANYDCDGKCLNDADGDGVCDSEEVQGCTDPPACNHDELATEDDGTCSYPDCAGWCGGSAVTDACGVCNGDGLSCAGPSACPENTTGLTPAQYINAQCCTC